MKKLLAALTLLLAGCATTDDIDLSKVEPACGQACSTNYSTCVGKFTIFPIQTQHQCADAMHMCAASCPARKPAA